MDDLTEFVSRWESRLAAEDVDWALVRGARLVDVVWELSSDFPPAAAARINLRPR